MPPSVRPSRDHQTDTDIDDICPVVDCDRNDTPDKVRATIVTELSEVIANKTAIGSKTYSKAKIIHELLLHAEVAVPDDEFVTCDDIEHFRDDPAAALTSMTCVVITRASLCKWDEHSSPMSQVLHWEFRLHPKRQIDVINGETVTTEVITAEKVYSHFRDCDDTELYSWNCLNLPLPEFKRTQVETLFNGRDNDPTHDSSLSSVLGHDKDTAGPCAPEHKGRNTKRQWMLLGQGGAQSTPHVDVYGFCTYLCPQQGRILVGVLASGDRRAWKKENDPNSTKGRWRLIVLNPDQVFVMPPNTPHFVARERRVHSIIFGGHFLLWSLVGPWIDAMFDQLEYDDISNEDTYYSQHNNEGIQLYTTKARDLLEGDPRPPCPLSTEDFQKKLDEKGYPMAKDVTPPSSSRSSHKRPATAATKEPQKKRSKTYSTTAIAKRRIQDAWTLDDTQMSSYFNIDKCNIKTVNAIADIAEKHPHQEEFHQFSRAAINAQTERLERGGKKKAGSCIILSDVEYAAQAVFQPKAIPNSPRLDLPSSISTVSRDSRPCSPVAGSSVAIPPAAPSTASECLVPGRMLTGEVMDRAFSTLISFDARLLSIRSECSDAVNQIHLSPKTRVAYMPLLCDNNHWVLLRITARRTANGEIQIYVFDHQPDYSTTFIADWVEGMSFFVGESSVERSQIRLQYCQGPMRYDGDCGVAVIATLAHDLAAVPPPQQLHEITRWRQFIHILMFGQPFRQPLPQAAAAITTADSLDTLIEVIHSLRDKISASQFNRIEDLEDDIKAHEGMSLLYKGLKTKANVHADRILVESIKANLDATSNELERMRHLSQLKENTAKALQHC